MGSVAHCPAQAHLRLVTLATALGFAACAGPGQDPDPGLRGYGTPSVSTYVPADKATSVQAMLDRCEQGRQDSPRSETQDLAAACDQLRHTLHNQPGNAVPVPAL